MKHKRNDPLCDLRDSQGDEKNAISFSIAFCLDFFIRNENITSKECKAKNRLRNNMACRASCKPSKLGGQKSCHGQTLMNECPIFDYPSNFEGL